MRRSLAGFPLLFLITACSAGGSTTPVLPQTSPTTTLSQAPNAAQATSSQASSEALAVSRQTMAASGANDLLYVGNTGNNSISVYWHGASGNTAPVAVIAGPNTGITSPGQLATDAAGNLYVANGASVLVFAHGANGNVAPIRTLKGPATQIHTAGAMTVDKATGALFVVDQNYDTGGVANLLRFAPNASGNAAPAARSTNDLRSAHELAMDSSGRNIIEANAGECCNVDDFGVDTYPKNFANNTPPSVVFRVGGFLNKGVADDPTTHTYLATTNSGIYRLAESTTGYGPDRNAGPISWKPTPVALITGDTCGTQLAVAPGPYPNTYVVHGTQSGCPSDAVVVYPHDANGNAAALRTLSGPATRLDKPYGIYEGP